MKYFLTLILSTLVLLMSASLAAQSDCDGDGNPDLDHNDGGGQGVGADHTTGNIAWRDLLTCDQQSGSVLITDSVDPFGACDNPSSFIPPGGLGSRVVRVAIIDSGVRPTHPGYFNDQRLFSFKVNSSGLVTEGIAHPHPHGTYSAGIISLMLNSRRRPEVHEFYDYQVLNENLRTSLKAVVGAIDHAVLARVDVISLSIGFLPSECDNMDWESSNNPLYAALDRANQAGVVVITSAGNDRNDLEADPQYPAAYVDLENVVSIGALGCSADSPTEFSNYGKNVVDLFTTGVNAKVFYNFCTHEVTGTSFATSIVAGKAAVHFSQTAITNEVLYLLRSQVRPFPEEQYSIYGIVDVDPFAQFNLISNRNEITSDEENLQAVGVSSHTVSPNPFQEQLNLKLGDQWETATISLFDGRGRKVLTQSMLRNELTLDLQDLTPGVYWLNIQNEEGSHTHKIIKQ